MNTALETLKEISPACEILLTVTTKDALLAMDKFAEQEADKITELFNKPAKVLDDLHDLWRKENPRDRFVIPDRTVFYKWIKEKVLLNEAIVISEGYIMIECNKRLPETEGFYLTDNGLLALEIIPEGLALKAGPTWKYGYNPRWWLQSIKIKNSNDDTVLINKAYLATRVLKKMLEKENLKIGMEAANDLLQLFQKRLNITE